jgi:hypothetical protein
VFVVAADLLVVLVSAFLCWKVLLFVLLLLLLKLFEPDLYDFASTVVELSWKTTFPIGEKISTAVSTADKTFFIYSIPSMMLGMICAWNWISISGSITFPIV